MFFYQLWSFKDQNRWFCSPEAPGMPEKVQNSIFSIFDSTWISYFDKNKGLILIKRYFDCLKKHKSDVFDPILAIQRPE